MHIDKKYYKLYSGDDGFEIPPPKIYVDWFYLPPCLKRSSKSCKLFNIRLGVGGRVFCFELNWGHVERELTEEERARQKYIKKRFNL